MSKRCVAVVLLLVVGSMLLIAAHTATGDAAQTLGLLLGSLSVGAALLVIHDTVTER